MRLIDADALEKEIETTRLYQPDDVIALITNAPTIEPIDDIISCGVSADRHTDQNVADVPSGDLISRADTLAKIKEYCIDGDAVVQNWFDTMGIEEVINTMPSVSADRPQVNSNSAEEQIAETCDRPKGEWKWTHGGQCSECGFHNTNFDFNFCPNCGADMRGEDDG